MPNGIQSRGSLASNISTGARNDSTVMDLKRELADIQSLRQMQSGGIGSTVGQAAGGILGGQVGKMAGGTVGSVVDYMINKDASDRAEQKRIDALRVEKFRQENKNQSDAWLDHLSRQRSLAIGEFGQKYDRYTLARQMRGQFIQQLFSKIANTKARKQNVNQ